MRTVDHGFRLDSVRAALDAAPWEPDAEDPTQEIKRVWLGTVFGLTPSGKFYTPFACGNVASCPQCGGHGSVEREPRTGRRIRRRAAARLRAFSRNVLKRGWATDGGAGEAYAKRVRRYRTRASALASQTCSLCQGVGSVEALIDSLWNDAAEEAIASCDAFMTWEDESAFACRSREREESECQEAS